MSNTKPLLLQMMDIAEVIYKFALDMWELITQDFYSIFGVSDLPDWAEPIAPFFELTLIEAIIGAVGFYIVYSIVKWVAGIVF